MVMANFRPSTIQPRASMAQLNTSTNRSTGIPHRFFPMRAKPVVPQLISSPGKIKAATIKA